MMGLPTTTPLAQKLWIASKIQGHKNPFGKPLSEYTTLELDWLLEMEAIENPAYRFVRAGESTAPRSEIFAAWHNVLTGNALEQFMRGKWSPKAAEVGARMRQKTALTPRITKKGKPIDA